VIGCTALFLVAPAPHFIHKFLPTRAVIHQIVQYTKNEIADNYDGNSKKTVQFQVTAIYLNENDL